MRTEQANMKGRVLPYDRHCLGLSKTEVQALEEQRTPYTVRLKVNTTMSAIEAVPAKP